MQVRDFKLYSAGLVGTQFLLIILICTNAFPVKPGIRLVPALILITMACVLAIYSALTLRLVNFSVMPEPVNHGVLTTSGPYRYIRHPMYTSVLTGCSGMLILNITPLGIVWLITLFAVLLLKINREELLLQAAYHDYKDYRQQTGALLPAFWR